MPGLSFRRRSPGLRPRLPWLFPTSRAMVRETAMGKYCNLPIGPDRRQWTTGGARRQSSAYGKGAYSFLSKPWVFPSCENEKRIPCSVMLSRRSPPGRVAPAAKRRRGPSALLATRAKMPPSSRTMPRSSQSTLISATPSTPTETRFDSASRSSSTVLPPTTTFQPTCRQPSYQPQRTELPPEPTSGLQEWARRKDRHSEQRQVRQRWKRPEAEDSSEQRHEASLGLQMAGWKAMS